MCSNRKLYPKLLNINRKTFSQDQDGDETKPSNISEAAETITKAAENMGKAVDDKLKVLSNKFKAYENKLKAGDPKESHKKQEPCNQHVRGGKGRD